MSDRRDGYPDLALLARRANALAAGTGFRIVVSDRDGTVVASSAPEFQPGQRFPLPREELEFFRSHAARLGQGDSFFGILEPPSPGQARIQLMAPMPGGLLLVITQALEQLRKSSLAASRFSLVVGLLILVAEFALVLLMSGGLVRPILELSEIAQRVASSDLSARYGHARKDELGRLGDSLNAMADTLARDIEDLKAANAGLADKVQAQQEFLAGASHELKTPVGLVRGYAEALKLGMYATDAEREELADIILTESDHLDRLVRDLSFIAMSGSTGRSLLPVVGDLRELATRTLARFALAAESGGIALRIEGGDPVTASYDPDRIVQALDNLLSNALRHAGRDGSVTLRLVAEGGLATIEVENTGSPIPGEHLARLFEPFYRVDAARSRRAGGSGLGLTLVRAVAEAHGGACGIENTATGVRAWMELPAAPGD